MGLVLNIVFFVLLILIWIIGGGFVTQSSVFLTSYKNDDPSMKKAYWYAFWVAFITWFLVGATIIGTIVAFATGIGEAAAAAAEEAYQTGSINYIVLGGLLGAFVLTITTGVLSILAAMAIVDSPHYKSDDYKLKKSYDNCVISSVLCIGSTGLIIIGIIVYLVTKEKQKRKFQEREEAINQKHEEKVNEIREIQKTKEQLLIENQNQKLEEYKQQLEQHQLELAAHKQQISEYESKLKQSNEPVLAPMEEAIPIKRNTPSNIPKNQSKETVLAPMEEAIPIKRTIPKNETTIITPSPKMKQRSTIAISNPGTRSSGNASFKLADHHL